MPVPPFCRNERTVEIPWLAARLAEICPRRVLDVGAADGFYWPELRAVGAEDVVLSDVRPFVPLFRQPGDRYTIAVVSGANLPDDWTSAFDTVISVSTIDHIGLDAYGQTADEGALTKACAELWRVTAPGGALLLTVPAGCDLWTTHPGGGQRVFSLASLRALFPPERWRWERSDLWRWQIGGYLPTDACGIIDAGYLGDRGDGVAALVLRKREAT